MRPLLTQLILAVLVTLNAAAADAPAWSTDFTNALKMAQRDQKPTLVSFTAPWCPYCKMMAQGTLKDKSVVEKITPIARVMVDFDLNPDVAARYNVRSLPAFVMVNVAGDAVARTTGYADARRFGEWLDGAVTQAALSVTLRETFRTQSREAETALASPDAEQRRKGVAMLLDFANKPETYFQEFATEHLKTVADREPALLFDSLNHPRLAARIQVSQLLRGKLGDKFEFDPWEKQETREQAVRGLKTRFAK